MAFLCQEVVGLKKDDGSSDFVKANSTYDILIQPILEGLECEILSEIILEGEKFCKFPAGFFEVVVVLYQESTDHVLDFHLDVFDGSVFDKWLVEGFVTFEGFVFELLVFHEVFRRYFALPFEFRVVAGQFGVERGVFFGFWLELVQMEQVTLEFFQSFLISLDGVERLMQKVFSVVVRGDKVKEAVGANRRVGVWKNHGVGYFGERFGFLFAEVSELVLFDKLGIR